MVVGDAMSGGRPFGFPVDGAQPSEGAQAFQMIGGLLSLIFLPAAIHLELQAAKGKILNVSEVLSASMRYFWRLLGLMLVIVIVTVLGLFALIVPGLIFIHRFFLAPYLLVAKDLSIREALSTSWDVSKGKAGPIWGVIGVMVLLTLFNIIPIFGGLISLVLLTLYTCASAYRYYEITDK